MCKTGVISVSSSGKREASARRARGEREASVREETRVEKCVNFFALPLPRNLKVWGSIPHRGLRIFFFVPRSWQDDKTSFIDTTACSAGYTPSPFMPQNKNHRLQGQELAIIGHVKIKTTTHKSYPTSAFSTYRWSSTLQILIFAHCNLSSIPHSANTHLNL